MPTCDLYQPTRPPFLGASDVMMIEADISLGWLEGSDTTQSKIPVMAHPPEIFSDLSLEDFINKVVKATRDGGLKKGIKLDFKSIEVAEAGLKLIKAQGIQVHSASKCPGHL